MEGKIKQSSAGKGDKSRISNYKLYKNNYEKIDWKKLKDGKTTIIDSN